MVHDIQWTPTLRRLPTGRPPFETEGFRRAVAVRLHDFDPIFRDEHATRRKTVAQFRTLLGVNHQLCVGS